MFNETHAMFQALLQDQHYLGIGFGKNMFSTDMQVFLADGAKS